VPVPGPDRPVRIAVIGVGSLGQHHARILAGLPQARLLAVVDRVRARAEEIAVRHGVPALTDLRDLPANIEAVTIAVPTVAHAELTRACLERGAAVLVEKPMAASLEQAEEMVQAARTAGRPLLVGHTERFNPALRAVRPRLRNPRFIEAHRLGVFSARSTDVDVVLDLMIHDLDVILSLVDAPLAAVDSVGVNALTDKIDIANARIRFANGCVANLTASRISVDRVRKLRIFEPDSYVSLDYATQEAVAYTLRRRPAGRPEIIQEVIPVQQEEPLLVELRSFLDTVGGGVQSGVPAEEGLRALRAAFQVVAQIGGRG
jgi:predicted dehydrogenase